MVEPPKSVRLTDLDPAFLERLNHLLDDLQAAGVPFRIIEGWRSRERQQWHYGSGRPGVEPFGRPGPIVTQRDGVRVLSNHQGTGDPGTGKAVDLWPVRQDGSVFCPSADDEVWQWLAEAAEDYGLVSGARWKMRDCPHVEMGA